MENCVIYARYSSHKQNDTSIEAQIAEAKAFAERNGYTIVGEYIDKAISGKSDERPEFLRMIEDSSKGKFTKIIVYQLDRFARNRYDSANYKNKLKKNGVKVLSAKENISDDASGILIESVLEGMAEYYSVELSQKVNRNMLLNAEKGQFNGGTPPLGYKLEIQDFGTYKKKKLVIDEETAPIVKKIFEMRANDIPVVEIIDFLNKKGYKNSRNREYNKNSLQNLFRNKKYIGTNTYGEKEFPNVIPAIIDIDTFNKVQEVREKYKHAPGIRKAKDRYLLTGKMFCGNCKSPMIGISGNSKSAKLHRYYTCNKLNDRDCTKKYIKKEYIEDIVVKKCKALLTDKNIDKVAKKIYEVCQRENNSNAVVKNLERRKRELNKNIDNLMSALENGQHIEMISNRITQNENELEETQSQLLIEMAKVFQLKENEIKFFLTRLQTGDILDHSYRKVLIDMFVNSIYVYDDKLIIICNVGNKPLTMSVNLLEDIEENLGARPFVERFSSPNY